MTDIMKTHFDPYCEDDPGEKSSCGILIGDNYLWTSIWSHVDCKRCLKQKIKMQREFEETEKIIIKQMGDMIGF